MVTKTFKWIRCHQVTAFFIITFLITWGLGFSYIAVMNGKYLVLPLMFISTCGPALAGTTEAYISGARRSPVKRRVSWVAFFISWIVATLVWFPGNENANKNS